ncbi:MAG: hypothetical protein J5948_02920 [Bacteroidales bacterium]|nr:hypothetical protein [Bacteroidales bacterium]
MRTFFLTPEQYGEMKQRYDRFNEPWSVDEMAELRQMAADNVPRGEMAAQLGRSPNAVRMKLQALGLYVPKPSVRPWTEEEEEKLLAMYRTGAAFADIATAFGRSERAILTRLVRLRAGLASGTADSTAKDGESVAPECEDPDSGLNY